MRYRFVCKLHRAVCAGFLCVLFHASGYGQPQSDRSAISGERFEGDTECIGCHEPQRNIPAGGHFANGFGRWHDSQCYGCHREITDVAKAWFGGIKDKRFYALPVKNEALRRISEQGMPYLTVKENIQPERFDNTRLRAFLSSPVSINPVENVAYPHMPAFPDAARTLRPASLFDNKKAESGEKLFTEKCSSCHSALNPLSGRGTLSLFLYTSDWLYRYANNKVADSFKRETESIARFMPVVAMTEKEADSLYHYFGRRYDEKQKKLEDDINRITFPGGATDRPNTQQLQYLWKHFFRDAGCVHCHGIEGRAKNHFDLSNESTLRSWLASNDARQLWLRLEIREWESKHGMGYRDSPGMPMTGAPIPQKIRNLIYRWVSSGCIDTSEKVVCKL